MIACFIVDVGEHVCGFQLCDSNTCLFSTPLLELQRTDLIFANKDIAFRICLVNSIGLAVIKHITINSITGFCIVAKVS